MKHSHHAKHAFARKFGGLGMLLENIINYITKIDFRTLYGKNQKYSHLIQRARLISSGKVVYHG